MEKAAEELKRIEKLYKEKNKSYESEKKKQEQARMKLEKECEQKAADLLKREEILKAQIEMYRKHYIRIQDALGKIKVKAK